MHRCLGLGQYPDAAVAPAICGAAQDAAGQRQRLGALRCGFGGDQVGDALHLRQVEPAIGKGAAAEFPRFGEAQAWQRQQCRQDAADHRLATVQVKFCQILAGGCGRAGEHREHRLVEHGAIGRIDQPAQRQPARFRQPAFGQRCCSDQRGRPRYPDHGNGSGRATRCQGHDGGGRHRPQPLR